MLSSIPLGRRITAASAAVVLAAAGLLLATRAGAAPAGAAGALHTAYGPGTAAHGLDPALLAVAGRKPAAQTDSARPDIRRDAAGKVVVQVEGSDDAALRAAVTKAGGTITGAVRGKVRATVPATALTTLAAAPGVRSVRPPVAARTTAVTSEGVHRSFSDDFQKAADGKGAGVTIAIVDAGFGGLDAAIAAGELPANTAVGNAGNFCGEFVSADDHGTAVAEIVHDMAPEAKLVLSCVADEIGLAQAATYVKAQGAKIVNMSLEFPGAGRGDGSGEFGSPADTIRLSRAAGLLWVVSAGNEGQSHFNGRVTDADRDGFVEIAGSSEIDGFRVAAHSTALVDLRWDAWPLTNSDLDLVVMSQPRVPTSATDPAIVAVSAFDQAGTAGGDRPTEGVLLDNSTGAAAARFYAVVLDFNITTSLRYDLTVHGVIDQMDRITPGGIGEPATSPAAVAVGAACYSSQQAIEPFSSTGPTIDGRTKPDITGYDGVSTSTYGPASGCTGGFLGTSAAAPHVAGAAAQMLGTNATLDAAELQGRLTAAALAPGPANVQNQYGAGFLTVGDHPAVAPSGDGYTALAQPKRVLDTRTSSALPGFHPGPFGPGETYKLTNLPVDNETAALVLNITGTNVTAPTFLSVYPSQFTGTSDLNLAAGETAANLVTATTLHEAFPSVTIRNSTGRVNVIVDLVGYYSPVRGAGYASRVTPARILDTRTTLGGHSGALKAGETYALPVRGVAGVPADASGAVLTVTGTGGTANQTFLSVFPSTNTGTSSVNLTKGATRAGLAISGIGTDGKVRIFNNSGNTHVVVDLAGWYTGDTSGAHYVPLSSPTRYLDTRTGNGFKLGPLGAAEAHAVPVAGIGAIPYDAVSIVGNLTGTGATANTFLSAFPAGAVWPGTSTVNLLAGRTVPNAIQVTPGEAGGLDVRNSTGKTHAILDVSGYFAPGLP